MVFLPPAVHCLLAASTASAITVGAINDNDTMATFSNYGKCVDIFAPGVKIHSSIPPSTYAAWSGTSMATPHVAGVAARLWAKGVCSTNLECAEAIRCLGTSGLVQGLDADSPNLLLHAPPGL
jgi:subtilisin family serine protease